ncbi:receptor expression-enhancing protein 5-like isoform X2 [Tetranychus urticae]|uniref:receptor expression-enhancing protein 5-like isoform X2 n=1 Tax=Tetranychus urticae TaxID=32264 RepID=UPI00077BFED1|nr:receptor expression-enhancing protein 5-like isoform X2 [Tetranychus urticae]
MFPFLTDLDDWLDSIFTSNPKISDIFNNCERFSHIDKHKLAKGLLFAFALYMTFGAFAQLICNVVGYVYPAIESLEALETPGNEDDRKWLTYWVVFAAFSVIEFYSDKIFHVFPVYFLAKLIFLVWAFWPSPNNGSIQIYNKFIRPFYLKKRSPATNIMDLKTTSLQVASKSTQKDDKNAIIGKKRSLTLFKKRSKDSQLSVQSKSDLDKVQVENEDDENEDQV